MNHLLTTQQGTYAYSCCCGRSREGKLQAGRDGLGVAAAIPPRAQATPTIGGSRRSLQFARRERRRAARRDAGADRAASACEHRAARLPGSAARCTHLFPRSRKGIPGISIAVTVFLTLSRTGAHACRQFSFNQASDLFPDPDKSYQLAACLSHKLC
jgi:hypothetical protein